MLSPPSGEAVLWCVSAAAPVQVELTAVLALGVHAEWDKINGLSELCIRLPLGGYQVRCF